MTMENSGLRKVVRASGIKRRKQILEATLRVILRDGIRGVRHRAIAEEAKVPLASTTYYFKDIEELLSETFLFWNHSANIYRDRFRNKILEHLGTDFDQQQLQVTSLRDNIANTFSELAITYVSHQITQHREDRLIELAFHHEAARSEKLRRVVHGSLAGQFDSLKMFYQLIGSDKAEADAQITISVLLRLEQEAVLAGSEINQEKIEDTVRRHINVMLLAASGDQQSKP
ncbi:TetR/AcrR family transcriptional regulator [Oceanicoccus sp. KOV_DT_Chl]|uniref:TetR/AcrR family transcriptional regulator n=1 Tax=Oceanicoccus sp. KOV_DT_Chl TaxID=1904639 RepID=UPI000C7E7BF7|nr:TetR family transcriptional regulator [Oceanicoccus sp. KOV_DT_Chl]